MNNNECSVILEKNTLSKRYIMQYCDEAFGDSICQRKNFEELFAKIDKNATFIWLYNQAVCGYAAMYSNDDESQVAYITLFAVKAEYQRRHMGLQMMHACCEIAKEKGMKTIRLEVKKDNERALCFYKRNGFEIVSEATENSFYMVKSL